jgi:hypothetical protein
MQALLTLSPEVTVDIQCKYTDLKVTARPRPGTTRFRKVGDRYLCVSEWEVGVFAKDADDSYIDNALYKAFYRDSMVVEALERFLDWFRLLRDEKKARVHAGTGRFIGVSGMQHKSEDGGGGCYRTVD